jgi:hypothetical protein
MLHRPRSARSRKLLAPLVLTLLVPTILFASSALAAPGTVVGTISPSSVPAGATTGLSFSLQPSSGQVGSFNLTAPTGWSITSLTLQAGVTLVGNTIQGRNISASSSSPFTVGFSVQAPCAASSTAWTLVARSGGGFTGNSFAVDPSSVLSTPLSGTCVAAFVADPTDAAFNGGSKSENITSLPYTPSGGTGGSSLLKVLVSDAGGTPRAGISITLQLSPNPTSLTGPITVTSDANGSATFGTLAAPVSVGELGLGYVMTPTGSGVTGTTSGEFGIYREGKPCSTGQSCVVHDTISDPKVGATVTSSDTGTLGVLVQPLGVDCAATVPAGYKYLPLPTASVIAWKFTGTGAQIITASIAKSLAKQVLDRGSSHLDVCFQADPLKPDFTDKFGNVVSAGLPGLLSDCSSAITQNCIISETASGGGGRLITFTVEDGKGRI